MIKPILTYSSEIWSQRYHKIYSESSVPQTNDSSEYEKVHNRVCKQLLGVGKLTSNLASRAELGRLPISVDIFKNTLRYWVKLEGSDSSSLLYQCLQSEKDLCSKGIKSWYTNIQSITRLTGTQYSDVNSNAGIRNVYNRLLKAKEQIHRDDQPKGNKLRTYATIKKDITMELYLTSTLSWAEKRTIAKFRTGNHKLRIETGRHCRPKLPPEQRICLHCQHNCTEDECILL
jgi:hypothetical protein